jgi:integrase/recombinase XerD
MLRDFVLEKHRSCGWAKAKKCTMALRMFLRFLIAKGYCAVGLEAAVPTLAHWRLATLPRYLQAEEVERVIASCDRSSPVGRRDRAILLLLARLGLRAGDIVHLQLSDIDWKNASIQVSGKSRRQTQLPLTQEIGQAIVEYLQDGRPRSSADTVFVRCRVLKLKLDQTNMDGQQTWTSRPAVLKRSLPSNRRCVGQVCTRSHAVLAFSVVKT